MESKLDIALAEIETRINKIKRLLCEHIWVDKIIESEVSRNLHDIYQFCLSLLERTKDIKSGFNALPLEYEDNFEAECSEEDE